MKKLLGSLSGSCHTPGYARALASMLPPSTSIRTLRRPSLCVRRSISADSSVEGWRGNTAEYAPALARGGSSAPVATPATLAESRPPLSRIPAASSPASERSTAPAISSLSRPTSSSRGSESVPP